MKTFSTTILAALLAVFMAGCLSPPGPHQTGGAFLGGASGALLGGAIGHGAGNTAAGAVIGGAIGALTGALIGKDIDERTRLRVEQGQPLTLEDIKALSRANVRDDLIISQINATHTVYRLGTAQIVDLKNAGVSDAVIDYMINTPATVVRRVPAPVYERHYYPVPVPHPFFFPPPRPYRYHGSPGHHWH
jgi:uncharacterized protein YcfJ